MTSDRLAPDGRDHSGSAATETEVGGPRAPDVPEDGLSKGESLGRYVVLDRIGGGGMGVVYAAYDPELDRKVAVKVLRRRRRRSGQADVDRLRMLREAQALARLSHPHVVAVYDAGLHDGRVFVAMDFVDGQDLRRWLKDADPGWREIVDAYVQAGRGLAAAHEAGLVHRDFKPDNAIRDATGRVRVLDFGLARASGHTGPVSPVPRDDRDAIIRRLHSDRYVSLETPVTLAGARVGTPAYMAPEQHLGETTDARTDQFAFCVSLYEALYRELPFSGESVHTLAFSVVEGIVREAPRGVRVPAWIRRALLRGLAPEPDARWPSLEALLTALQRDPGRAWRHGAFGSVVLASLLGGGAWYQSVQEARQAPCQAARERVDAVWNHARRARIESAFAATARTDAARTASDVGTALDRWAAEWASAHTDACEATHVRQEQSDTLLDARMACLSSRIHRLEALAARFEDADGGVVDHAVEAVRGLPSVTPCADVEALRHKPPRPAGAGEIWRGLAEVRAAGATGKSREAVELARPVLEQARALGDLPLLAESLFAFGTALEAAGEYREAEGILVEAEIAAEPSADVDLLADIRTTLVLVSGDRLAVAAQGHLWAKLAAAALERAGARGSRLARLQNNESHVYEKEGRPDDALARRHEALESLESDSEPDELVVASINADLATALADRGQLDEAEMRAHRALDLLIEVLGPEHRRTGNAHAVMAFVHEARGEYRESLAQADRAIEILAAADGDEAPSVAGVRRNAAITAIHLGDYERGERDFRRVLQNAIDTFGPEHAEVASAYGNLSGIVRMRGRLDEAETYARRSLELRERAQGRDHPDVAHSLATLANVLEELGRRDEVVTMRERVLQINAKTYGASHRKLLIDYANLAYSAAHGGQVERAREAAQEAMALAESDDTKPELAAYARLVLAVALTADKRAGVRGEARERVRTLVDEARALIADMPAPVERELIAELAEAHGFEDLVVPGGDTPAN